MASMLSAQTPRKKERFMSCAKQLSHVLLCRQGPLRLQELPPELQD
jgi:hypothetical protein